jgi:hypothetical protein
LSLMLDLLRLGVRRSHQRDRDRAYVAQGLHKPKRETIVVVYRADMWSPWSWASEQRCKDVAWRRVFTDAMCSRSAEYVMRQASLPLDAFDVFHAEALRLARVDEIRSLGMRPDRQLGRHPIRGPRLVLWRTFRGCWSVHHATMARPSVFFLCRTSGQAWQQGRVTCSAILFVTFCGW